jgi:hypothetical protein
MKCKEFECSSKEIKKFEKFEGFEMSLKGVKCSKCLKNAKMHIGREMSIIEVMHRRCRHGKKSRHAQLHAQSIPMCISMQTTLIHQGVQC